MCWDTGRERDKGGNRKGRERGERRERGRMGKWEGGEIGGRTVPLISLLVHLQFDVADNAAGYRVIEYHISHKLRSNPAFELRHY